jgi:uncharacterized protein YndB with AHSA1/START domain
MGEFRFIGEWRIGADADRVYAALADVEAYPEWWPGIVATRRIDSASGEIRVRELLPVDLVFTATQRTADPVRRVLVALFAGDLEGIGRWEIIPVPGGTRARYYEHLAVRVRLARAAGPLARPLIHAGHERLMRVGERGLAAYLDTATSAEPTRRLGA